MIIERDYHALLAANGLNTLDALFQVGGSQRFDKPGLPDWRERVQLDVTDADGHSRTIFLKRYTRPPAWVQFKRWLTGSIGRGTAWMEWHWLHELHRGEERRARPIAYGQRMRGPWEHGSALLMAAVPGDALERWVLDHPGRAPRDLIGTLARFIAGFHADGFVHRDLYLSHVFYDNADPGPPRFRLIDLQRVFRPRWRRSRWIVKDLAALNYSTPSSVASTTDRLRWLRTYLGVPKLRGHDRRLARQIAAKTRQIARHDRRRHARHGTAASVDRNPTEPARPER